MGIVTIKRRVGCLSLLALVLAGCGSLGEAPPAVAYSEPTPVTLPDTPGQSTGEAELVDSASVAPSTTTTAASTPSTNGAPAVVSSVESARTTSEGIVVAATPDTEDFGSGPQEVIWVTGERNGSSAGVTVDPDFIAGADTRVIDSLGWAGSANIFVVMFHVGPEISQVRLVSSQGGVDMSTPDDDGLVVLGVEASDVSEVSAQAFDDEGHVLGTCSVGETFFDCVS